MIKTRSLFIVMIFSMYQFVSCQSDITKNLFLEKRLVDQEFTSFYQCQREALFIRQLMTNNSTNLLSLLNIPVQEVSKNNISFVLFTRNNLLVPQRLHIFEDAYSIKGSKFNPNNPTVFFVDGYAVPSNRSIGLLPSRLLSVEDYNLIIIDWDSYNSFNLQYTRNITVPLIGNIVAEFIHQLLAVGADPKQMYLIGFSAGGEIVALAAKRIRPKIARILALEPEGSCFNFLPDSERISSSDADYVSIVHSSVGLRSLPLNILGNSTFYINGGFYQDRCLNRTKLLNIVTCSHEVSADYFFDSLLNFRLSIGIKCNSYEEYLRKECNCHDIGVYGFYTSVRMEGLYFVDTVPFQSTSNNPSCGVNYLFLSDMS